MALRDDGQASPEWLGLILVIALSFAAAVAAGASVPGAGLAQAIANRLACAVGVTDDGCGGDATALASAYGPELAGEVLRHAPRLDYESGMRALPVDFRSCREDACAEGAEAGAVSASLAGERVTLFSRVVDCRDPAEPEPPDARCGGDAAGNLYLQFWAYYPGSQTSRALFGEKGFHPDDWESWQVRIALGGAADARASSHHGYNGASGDPLNDTGWFGGKAGWVASTGRYLISGGSHAGRVGSSGSRSVRGPSSIDRGPSRWTPSRDLRLIPIESLRAEWGDHEFEVVPPWAKPVFLDPEYRGT